MNSKTDIPLILTTHMLHFSLACLFSLIHLFPIHLFLPPEKTLHMSEALNKDKTTKVAALVFVTYPFL